MTNSRHLMAAGVLLIISILLFSCVSNSSSISLTEPEDPFGWDIENVTFLYVEDTDNKEIEYVLMCVAVENEIVILSHVKTKYFDGNRSTYTIQTRELMTISTSENQISFQHISGVVLVQSYKDPNVHFSKWDMASYENFTTVSEDWKDYEYTGTATDQITLNKNGVIWTSDYLQSPVQLHQYTSPSYTGRSFQKKP